MPHHFDPAHPRHEVERNNDLIAHFTDGSMNRPAIYPSAADEEKIRVYCSKPFITISPSSVWFTKKISGGEMDRMHQPIPQGYRIFYWAGPITGKNANH